MKKLLLCGTLAWLGILLAGCNNSASDTELDPQLSGYTENSTTDMQVRPPLRATFPTTYPISANAILEQDFPLEAINTDNIEVTWTHADASASFVPDSYAVSGKDYRYSIPVDAGQWYMLPGYNEYVVRMYRWSELLKEHLHRVYTDYKPVQVGRHTLYLDLSTTGSHKYKIFNEQDATFINFRPWNEASILIKSNGSYLVETGSLIYSTTGNYLRELKWLNNIRSDIDNVNIHTYGWQAIASQVKLEWVTRGGGRYYVPFEYYPADNSFVTYDSEWDYRRWYTNGSIYDTNSATKKFWYLGNAKDIWEDVSLFNQYQKVKLEVSYTFDEENNEITYDSVSFRYYQMSSGEYKLVNEWGLSKVNTTFARSSSEAGLLHELSYETDSINIRVAGKTLRREIFDLGRVNIDGTIKRLDK